ncbi:MAG: VCBS repeat-containing protein [Nitrosomonas sp.]|nr:VCBS repeat-containing protein [Nitrosomonas sp.]MBP6077066.1 VCBS repeat-containing protein [Nitrosomonas sp.]
MSDPIFTLSFTNPFGLSGVSSYASPTFVDIDSDGDLDAFIGNVDGNTMFFRNTGTVNSPAFSAPSINSFGLSDVGYAASPTFVDIDGDGDLDAFVGEAYGNTLFFKNTGTAGAPIFSAAISNSFGLSDVGYAASPTFVDIDGDGDLDAFVGNGASNTLFFRNTGMVNNPLFAAPSTNPFGLTNVGFDYASPAFVDIDGDGDLDAFVGNGGYYGGSDMLFFKNTGTASTPILAVATTNPFGLSNLRNVGLNADPTFVDIDGDGDLDAFVGSGTDTVFFVNNGLSLVNTQANDILTGTPSNNDTVTYAAANSAITISLLITTQQNTIGAGLDTLTDVENLVGSAFNDNLTGNTLNNVLDGKAGNDTLRGWSGADTMIGGLGNDTFFVENLKDIVIEKPNEGTDTVSSNVTYTLPTNVENLTLTGTAIINGTGNTLNNIITGNNAANQLNGDAGNDTLNGGGGDDTLIGWSGADTMVGGLDNDTYFVENAGDVVTENLNQGTDTVSSRLTCTLPVNVENLILTGTSAVNGTGNNQNNIITGNNAANQLNGGAGNDTLSGSAGNDVLDGGTGTNTLTGGTGNDVFKFTTTGHIDTITDYNVANDTIQLENAVFTALTATGTLAAGQFRIGKQALDANDFIIYNNVTGALLYDANGSGAGAAVQIATIGVGLAMTNAEFVVI